MGSPLPRMLVMTHSTCSAIVLILGGNRPCKPLSVRSVKVKAVPLLSRGLFNKAKAFEFMLGKIPKRKVRKRSQQGKKCKEIYLNILLAGLQPITGQAY